MPRLSTLTSRAPGELPPMVGYRRPPRSQFARDPVKMNYLTLGNTVPHLHTHVVPRYRDDPAPGGPIAWEQISGPEPVPEADLHRQAASLRALLAR